MLSSSEFLKQSLGLHLFFTRIMKEHSFFLEIALHLEMLALPNRQIIFVESLTKF